MEALVDNPDGSPPEPAGLGEEAPLGDVERETRKLSSRADLQATGFEIGEFNIKNLVRAPPHTLQKP